MELNNKELLLIYITGVIVSYYIFRHFHKKMNDWDISNFIMTALFCILFSWVVVPVVLFMHFIVFASKFDGKPPKWL